MKPRKSKMKNPFVLRDMNPVIKVLTISDFLIISGFGLITPVFAVFVTDTITGGTLAVVGIAAAIYLLARSIGQIPVGAIIDRIRGERDDFWAMFIGSIVFSIVPLFYLIITTPFHLYLVQLLFGLSTAAVLPPWMAIFIRHIDKKHEGLEWGIYQTLIDLGGAGAASLGGFLAFQFGFSYLFVLVSIASFIGSFFLLGVYHRMKQ